MDITPRLAESVQIIQAYGDGGFRINNVAYPSSLYVFTHEVIEVAIERFSDVTEASFVPFTEALEPVEILLIGTGKTMQLLSASLRQTLKAAGISAEVMDTGAACRTYNVLLAEGRRVAALLVKV